MDEITEATYHFLDALDNSKLIKELTKYKNIINNDKTLLKQIEIAKQEQNTEKLIDKRKTIYNNQNYQKYMDCYNELSLIILKINKQYQKYTNTTGSCH